MSLLVSNMVYLNSASPAPQMGPSGSGKTVSPYLMHHSIPVRSLASHDDVSTCVRPVPCTAASLSGCSPDHLPPLDVHASRPYWTCWLAARTRASSRVTLPLAARCPPGPTCADTRGEGEGVQATAYLRR